MTAKYRRVYAALKRIGFSPDKALEVLFDAKRNGYLHGMAMSFVRVARVSGRE